TTAQAVLRSLHANLVAQPFFTQRWWRVRRLVDAHAMPEVSALLQDRTEDLDMRDRYAARIAFFEFVRSEHPDKMLAVAQTIRQTGAGTSYASTVAQQAERLLGPLSAAFVRAVGRRRPAWDETYRSLWLLGAEWRQMAFAN